MPRPEPPPKTTGLRAVWRFLQLGFSDFDTTASLLPSSPFLVEAMLAPAGLADARRVVELGTGTGTLTQEILARLGPEAVLYGVELDPDLAAATTSRLRDARLRVLEGSAADVHHLVAAEDVGQVDVVISSLGLSLMDEALRTAIVREAGRVLRPDGVYMQYAYAHARWFAWSQRRREYFRWHARPFLERHFHEVEGRFVAANVPPAIAFTCRRAVE